MKIKTLTIENFLIIGNAEINLDNRGLVLIQGVNDDDTSANSNGAGKSSIVDAISWCLYGETARGVSGDAVINDSVGKGCFVTLVVEDAGASYVISRGRKDKVLKNGLSVFSDGANLTKGTDKLTQELVNKIVGCSYDVFIAAVYSGQEKLPDLPAMSDKMLKLIVEEAAGIERLEAAHGIALTKSKIAQGRVDGINQAIKDKTSLMESYNRDIETFKGKEAQFEREIEVGFSELSAIMYATQERFKTLPEPIDALNMGLYVRERAEIDKKIEDSQGKEKAELASLDEQVMECEKQLSRWKIEVRIDTDEAKAAKLELDNVGSRVGNSCGECGKEYCEDDIYGARVNTQNKLKSKLRVLKRDKAYLEQVENSLNIALETRKKFIDAMTDVSELLKRHSEIRSLVAESDKRAQAQKEVTAEITALELKLAETEAKKSPYLDIIESRKVEIASLVKQKESLTADLLVLEDELSVTKDAVEVFSRAGVRAHILDTVTPFLNERTAEYLGTLTDGNITASWSTLGKTAKGELRERFGIAVEKSKGSKTFAGLSGGEKRKVRLATALSLQDLVASRATKPIEFCFFDEIDTALDSSAIERLMVVLESKAKSTGTVLVISHNDLNSFVDTVMTVTNVGGVSTVSDF